MKSTTIVSTLLGGTAALNVVKFDIYRVQDSAFQFSKRDTIYGELENQIAQYNINLTIGTPPQPFSLQLATGSSDLWVNTAESAFCSDASNNCTGGLYDSAASSTYHVSIPGGFDISYVDTTGASGDYGLDTVVIGGVTILNQTFGVANVSNITAGLIGVSFANDEAICHSAPCLNSYPSIVDSMVAQGKINTRAYSLWLDDLNASTGSILFGGIDTSKYKGDLVGLDIIPDPARSNETFKFYSDFNVIWSNMTVSTLDNFWNESDETLAILDSGTTYTYLPTDAYDAISTGLNVSSAEDGYSVDCSLGQTDTTIDFTFGGSDGPTISVDISEVVLDNGDGTCRFGMRPSDPPYLLGDTFLRSAYVVYDLDSKVIAIAQTNFEAGEPNVIEIAQDIPNVSSTANPTYLPPATASATGAPTPIGPVTATGSATGTISAPPSTYTGAGVVLQPGSKYTLGFGIAALPMIMAL